MSRVIYADTPATADQAQLRVHNKVRLVVDAEEGTGVDLLPAGTYGFTYSPALANAPLFATRRFRSYETHKTADGEVAVIGFASAADARQMTAGHEEVTVQVQPEPDDTHTQLVSVPYSRIRRHRQYAAPNEHGFTATLLPLDAN